MHDIVGTMFNKRFMEELFKPQDTYSKKAMRTVFDRLAHASIMRLNSASMDKVTNSEVVIILSVCKADHELQHQLRQNSGNVVGKCYIQVKFLPEFNFYLHQQYTKTVKKALIW